MPLTMEGRLHGSVRLPLSKSESQRALMIAAYGPWAAGIGQLEVSKAHDTVLLQALLRQVFAADGAGVSDSALDGAGVSSADAVRVDCEDAGTVARFLLPLLAGREGTWLMTGTERLCQRPMAPLVKALRQLGADIVCMGEEGMLPLRVQGRPLRGGAVTLDASQSSQFASALLLAAPQWEQGLTLRLEGPVASKPYLDMTLAMMQQAGAVVHAGDSSDSMTPGTEPDVITVLPKPYQSYQFDIAPDWSAASYWYEFAALNAPCQLLVEGLRPASLQGDAVVASWYERFGVQTRFEPQGAVLTKVAVESEPIQFDFSATPDLFPAVMVTCVALHLPAVFTGIRNLSLKESNRVTVLITELSKLYTFINIVSDDSIILQESRIKNNDYDAIVVSLDTHHDHRIAMALAPLKRRFPRLVISHPEVVEKSYPSYWTEIEPFIG